MKKITSLLLCLALLLALPAFAEEDLETRLDALSTELEAAYDTIDALQTQLDEMADELGTLYDEFYSSETSDSTEDTATPEEDGDVVVDTTEEETEEETPDIKDFADEDVVATINGKEVTYADISSIYDYYTSVYGMYFDMTDPSTIALLRDQSLYTYAQDQIIIEKATELGKYPLSDEELAAIEEEALATYQETLTYYKDFFVDESLTDEEVTEQTVEYLTQNGYTEESVVSDAKANAVYDIIYEDLTKDITMTDDEVREKYAASVEEAKASYESDASAFETDAFGGSTLYYIPEGWRTVRQILLSSDDGTELQEVVATLNSEDATEDEKATAQTRYDELMADLQPKIDDIYARLESGEAFETLMAEYNEDPGMEEDSEYYTTGYYVSSTSTMWEQSFTDAAMSIETIGGVSDPAYGSYGIYIVYYMADLPAGEVALDEANIDTLREEYLTEEKDNAYSTALDTWMADVDIQPVEGFVE